MKSLYRVTVTGGNDYYIEAASIAAASSRVLKLVRHDYTYTIRVEGVFRMGELLR